MRGLWFYNHQAQSPSSWRHDPTTADGEVLGLPPLNFVQLQIGRLQSSHDDVELRPIQGIHFQLKSGVILVAKFPKFPLSGLGLAVGEAPPTHREGHFRTRTPP